MAVGSRTGTPHPSWLYIAPLVGTLLLLHLLMVGIDRYAPGSSLQAVVPWFDLDREKNVPTLVSSLLFAGASYYALRLTILTRLALQRIGWGLIACLFGYFALDEYFFIHEQLAEPIRQLLAISSGPLFHAWVVPAAIGLGVLGVIIIVGKRYWQQLIIFSEILTYLFLLIGVVVVLEVGGTYVFHHTAFYRFVMIPLEEVFELSLASTLCLRARRLYLSKKSQRALSH